METERTDVTNSREESGGMPFRLLGWKTTFLLGLVTFLLGLVVIARPTESLIAIAVLLGVVMIVSGIFHIVRALDGRETERVWRGITGVLSLLAGLVLLRHLHLTVALIGLFIGFTWIIQGIASLMETSVRGRSGGERGWTIFFGIISLIAGIVVVAAPIASVAALTIFMGAWFIVLGIVEMGGSIIVRRAMGKRPAEPVDVPEQRAGTTAAGSRQDMAGQRADTGSEPKSRNVPH